LTDHLSQASELPGDALQSGILDDGAELPPTEGDEETVEVRPTEPRAESLFSADLGATMLLTCSQAEVLAREIARARKHVRAILRRAPLLTRTVLSDRGGRKAILPERDS
jgi:hypothetical protein